MKLRTQQYPPFDESKGMSNIQYQMSNKQVNFKFQIIKYTNLFFICLFAYWLIGLFVVFQGKAFGESFSLAVSPPIIQIQAKPPSDIKSPITVKNLTDQTIDLDIELRLFKSSEKENGELVFISKKEDFYGQDPFIFEKIAIIEDGLKVKKISLSPLAQKKLELLVEIPKDEPPSDYYFSVLFKQNSKQDRTQEGKAEIRAKSFIQGAIATNVLLSIGGEKGKAQGVIEEFKAPFILEKGPVPFTVKIKNNSSYFLMPKGEIIIENFFRQKIGKIELLPVSILSKSSRFMQDSKRKDTLSDKAYWDEKLILGPYKATLTVSLSENGPVLVKTARFMGAPILSIIGLVIALSITGFIVKRVKDKRQQV